MEIKVSSSTTQLEYQELLNPLLLLVFLQQSQLNWYLGKYFRTKKIQ